MKTFVCFGHDGGDALRRVLLGGVIINECRYPSYVMAWFMGFFSAAHVRRLVAHSPAFLAFSLVLLCLYVLSLSEDLLNTLYRLEIWFY